MNVPRRRRAVGLLCMGCASLAIGALASADATQTVEAVWKVQHVTFGYGGRDSSYTCAGMRARLRSILMHLGARETMTITVRGCDERGSVAVASITLTSPVEATPENIHELTTHDSRSELLARARGVPLASAADLPRFPAVWRTVSFANALHLRLSPADCDLLKHLRREIFPRLAVRIVDDEIRCSTALSGIARPKLTVAALIAAH